MTQGKIWSHSGDSHFLEPDGLWQEILPKEQADRMPRSEKINDHEEIVHVDGQSFRRDMPSPKRVDGKAISEMSWMGEQIVDRRTGMWEPKARLVDCDNEGVWGEVIFPSLALWDNLIRDPKLVRDAPARSTSGNLELQGVAPERWVVTASMPLLSVQDAVAALTDAIEIGFKAFVLPTGVPEGVDDWQYDSWDPLWSLAEESGMVVCYHTGTDRLHGGAGRNVIYGGSGGAILNYVETTYTGQHVATKLVAGGALDRHPAMKVLIAEAGSSWVPFLGDRMNEGFRQHAMFVRPQLSALPKEILYRQIYTSFQHDETAVAAMTSMGYNNILWGSDYPHLEGTFGHTQETLHHLFDDVDAEVRHRITVGALRSCSRMERPGRCLTIGS